MPTREEVEAELLRVLEQIGYGTTRQIKACAQPWSCEQVSQALGDLFRKGKVLYDDADGVWVGV